MIESFIRALAGALDRDRPTPAWAELAREQLARAAADVQLDAAAVVRFACGSLPQRGRHDAAEVLPLWSGEHVEILAHLWLDTIAPPHDHGWTGAFHIFAGRSLNSYHRFDGELDARGATIGVLERERLIVHGPGDTIAVSPGPAFIHAVQYLDRPGLAISVRTKQRAQASTTYFRPGLAVGERAIDDDLRARLRALTSARAMDEALWLDGLGALLDAGCPAASFLALSDAVQAGHELPDTVHAIGEARHGHAWATMLGALDDVRAYQELVELRSEHHDPQLRAVLAALYACQTRDQLPDALAAVGALEAGGDPWACIGAALVTLWVDTDGEDDGELELPPQLPVAFARLAQGRSDAELRDELPESPDVLELIGSARAAMAASPLHRALCSDRPA